MQRLPLLSFIFAFIISVGLSVTPLTKTYAQSNNQPGWEVSNQLVQVGPPVFSVRPVQTIEELPTYFTQVQQYFAQLQLYMANLFQSIFPASV